MSELRLGDEGERGEVGGGRTALGVKRRMSELRLGDEGERGEVAGGMTAVEVLDGCFCMEPRIFAKTFADEGCRVQSGYCTVSRGFKNLRKIKNLLRNC